MVTKGLAFKVVDQYGYAVGGEFSDRKAAQKYLRELKKNAKVEIA